MVSGSLRWHRRQSRPATKPAHTDQSTALEPQGAEYLEDLPAASRLAIQRSPVLRLCARRRDMEQEQARSAGAWTAEGVPIGMESRERRLIDLEGTKQVMAVALAVEIHYDIDTAYAVDGSADEVATLGQDEEGAVGAPEVHVCAGRVV